MAINFSAVQKCLLSPNVVEKCRRELSDQVRISRDSSFMADEKTFDLLDSYIEQVTNPRDKVLFTEAIQAAKASALRAAYIILWLSCIESWKRKFQERAASDLGAAKVVEKFEALEASKLPTNEYLLEQAKQFGLLLTKDYANLEHICILQRAYSRPYEKQPKLEAFAADASTVLDAVLGQPTGIQASRLTEQIHLLSQEVNSLSTSLRQRMQ